MALFDLPINRLCIDAAVFVIYCCVGGYLAAVYGCVWCLVDFCFVFVYWFVGIFVVLSFCCR